MNAPFSIRHREALVGVFVLGALAILMGIVILTLIRSEVFEDYYSIRTVFSMGIGLKPGASVALAGLNIGTVSSVELNPEGKIEIEMRINRQYQTRIRANSTATVRRLNPAVGDKFINLSPGSASSPVLEDGQLIKGEDPAELEDALSSLTSMAASLEKIIKRLEQGQGTVGALLQNRELLDSLQQMLSVGSQTLRQAGTLVGDVEHLAENLDSVLKSVPPLVGQVGGLTDEATHVAQKADTLLEMLHAIASSTVPVVKEGEGVLQEASDITQSVKQNWLIRRTLPKEKDEWIYEETRK